MPSRPLTTSASPTWTRSLGPALALASVLAIVLNSATATAAPMPTLPASKPPAKGAAPAPKEPAPTPKTPAPAPPADDESSEWVMGTPFAIEVEAGFAAVPVSFVASEGSGVINVAEDPQAGGSGFVAGARVGFPDLLYEGLGVFATFHYFVADISHAINVGAALRYGHDIVDFFGLELQAGATFFATLSQISVAYTLEGNAVPVAAESTPLGLAVEITPGAYFPLGPVRLGARGLIEIMVLTSGHPLVETPVAVGGGIEATFGVWF